MQHTTTYITDRDLHKLFKTLPIPNANTKPTYRKYGTDRRVCFDPMFVRPGYYVWCATNVAVIHEHL